MKKIVRMASGIAMLIGAAALAPGCATECHDETDPETGKTIRVCEAENLVRYNGSEATETVDYVAGENIVINGVNGNIVVNDNGPADKVSVTFKPFSFRGNDEADKDLAVEDMQNDLTTSITPGVSIDVGRAGGSNAMLGADLVVTLPDGYTGGITINVGNGFLDANLGGTQAFTTIDNDGSGDIDVKNAAGPLSIVGKFDINVAVLSWSDQDGAITSTGQLGDVSVSVPAGANGSIQATSEDETVTGPSSAPADWTEEAAAENSKTFSFGDGTTAGGNVVVTAAKSVTINGG
jgi:hypothetical protein